MSNSSIMLLVCEVINIVILIFLFFESAFFAGAQAQLRGGVGDFNVRAEAEGRGSNFFL